VAIRTDQFAVGDLGFDAFQSVRLPDQPADLHPFRADVIELEHGWVPQAAVGACTLAQDLD
jgi:hypothetical protein